MLNYPLGCSEAEQCCFLTGQIVWNTLYHEYLPTVVRVWIDHHTADRCKLLAGSVPFARLCSIKSEYTQPVLGHFHGSSRSRGQDSNAKIFPKKIATQVISIINTTKGEKQQKLVSLRVINIVQSVSKSELYLMFHLHIIQGLGLSLMLMYLWTNKKQNIHGGSKIRLQVWLQKKPNLNQQFS